MSPSVLSFGGGSNSAGLLVGLIERRQAPDLILFADTGAEKPETYQFILQVSDWLERQGLPRIVTVKYRTRDGVELSLEEDCLIRRALPAIAYGWKTCSDRWKRRPQDQYIKAWPQAVEAWARGEKVTKLIGFDAGEPQRARPFSDEKFTVRYPLIEWDWDRENCTAAIRRAGLPLPGKSSCFFCPSMTKKEVVNLARQHPALYQRAVAMEANANLTTVAGLGRRFAWIDLPTWDLSGLSNPDGSQILQPCDCYDGGAE